MIAGRGESGAIVCTPVAGMSKMMLLVPPPRALESRIAWRREPGPLSAVVVTVTRPLVTLNWTWAGTGAAPNVLASRFRVRTPWNPGGETNVKLSSA